MDYFTESLPATASLLARSSMMHYFVAAALIYQAIIILYRLYFSPLAKFPGPKLAAATGWYEGFFDIWKANFPDILESLHDKYGPIVRINPTELSIRDPDYYNTLYVSSAQRKTNLIPGIRAGLGMSGTGSIVSLDHAFSCFTGDLAAQFACGDNPMLLEEPDFNPEWHGSLMGILAVVPYVRNFPWINSILSRIPVSLLRALNPHAAGFRMFHLLSEDRVEKVKSQIAASGESEEPDKTSVFHYILQSDLPESEKDPARLKREAFALLAAGTITTSTTLSTITYYVLADPNIQRRLQEDLKDLMRGYPVDFPSWTDLEKVPYLTACIKEGLRISRFFRRSARVSPDCDLQYKGWTIPKNTPVAMSICHMLMDPDIYPEPFKFLPDRWLGDIDSRMNHNFVPFAKGSRNCLGSNLAWSECYIALAVLFRPKAHKMSLECDESDIQLAKDSDVGIPKNNSKGLRICFN